MTWLKGSTTWGNLATDLTKLICGEIADGSSVTCAAGDRWVRDVTRTVTDAVLNSTTTLTSATAAFTAADVGSYVIATGVPSSTTIATVTNATTVVLSAAATATASGVSAQICLDTIRTPAAKDVATGACANRTGYFSALGVPSTTAPMSATGPTVCRVTNPFTSEPGTQTLHRWIIRVTVLTANSVAGNYSTATLSTTVLDADGFNTSAFGGTPNAAGLVTGMSNGLQVTLSDPSGFLTAGTVFVRAFSTTYMYGIDCWPMLYRASGATTFGTAPPGVAGTDYDIVTLGILGSTNGALPDRGGLFCGLAIKTATANTGALYTVSENMALAKCRIFASATAGQLSLDIGGNRVDTAVAGALRCLAGLRITAWCKMFQTPGSVTAASLVQYFLSVKNDGIVLVVNGDPGFSGKLGTAFIGAYTPADPTYDVLPIMANWSTPDFTIDQTDSTGVHWSVITQYGYWPLRRRQDGSEGSRDWQTKWMRGEGLPYIGSSGQSATDVAPSVSTGFSPTLSYQVSVPGVSTNPGVVAYTARQNKPGPDGKWWTYGYTYAEGNWSSPTPAAENQIIRGTQSTRFLHIPGDGWGSGDELTDTSTGTKYLLVIPDYPGIGCRLRNAANTYYGGLAVAEV